MMIKLVEVKKFKAELIVLAIVFLNAILITCTEVIVTLEMLEKAYTLCLQVITATIGLYFTAFTIFIGLGLSPKKLDTSKIRNKLLSKEIPEDQIDEIIEEKILSPYKETLEQASQNFKETIMVLAIIFFVSIMIYAIVILNYTPISHCGNNCYQFINAAGMSFVIWFTAFTIFLIYDSAIFLMNIRKLI